MKNEAAGKTKPTRKPNKRATKAAPQSSSELGAVSWVDALRALVASERETETDAAARKEYQMAMACAHAANLIEDFLRQWESASTGGDDRFSPAQPSVNTEDEKHG